MLTFDEFKAEILRAAGEASCFDAGDHFLAIARSSPVYYRCSEFGDHWRFASGPGFGTLRELLEFGARQRALEAQEKLNESIRCTELLDGMRRADEIEVGMLAIGGLTLGPWEVVSRGPAGKETWGRSTLDAPDECVAMARGVPSEKCPDDGRDRAVWWISSPVQGSDRDLTDEASVADLESAKAAADEWLLSHGAVLLSCAPGTDGGASA